MHLTITTGKRIEYFERMLISLAENCLDLNLIDFIYVSDDGSNSKDIKTMMFLLNQTGIKYTMDTTIKEKGQLSSINNIYKYLDCEWFFHLEDDWEFIKKDNFITKMLEITKVDDLIKNVTLKYRDGLNVVQNGINYKVHFFKRITGFNHGLANSTWYGYTLNPGLQHLPTIKRIGLYDEKFSKFNRYWDRSFAYKYYQLGYKSANLPYEYINHIGIKSAYDSII